MDIEYTYQREGYSEMIKRMRITATKLKRRFNSPGTIPTAFVIWSCPSAHSLTCAALSTLRVECGYNEELFLISDALPLLPGWWSL